MAKILISAIKNEDKVSANGKSYTRCSIKTVDTKGNETWISGFGNATTKSWVKGQVVELEVYAEDYQGKTYYKFKDVAERSLFVELDKINSKLDQLINTNNIKTTLKEFNGEVIGENSSIPYSDAPLKVDDIPF
jgi:hypothetical protein